MHFDGRAWVMELAFCAVASTIKKEMLSTVCANAKTTTPWSKSVGPATVPSKEGLSSMHSTIQTRITVIRISK